MTHEDTLVNITIMPSISPDSTWKQRVAKEGVFPKNQGIVIKGWTHWSDHIECKAQYLDILTGGEVVRFWRPSPEKSLDWWFFDEPGFWEIGGVGTQSYEISPVQCTTSE